MLWVRAMVEKLCLIESSRSLELARTLQKQRQYCLREASGVSRKVGGGRGNVGTGKC